MSNVVDFPSASVKNDADIEKGFRVGLQNHGFSPEAIEAALKTVMPLMHEAKSTTAKNLSFSLNSTLTDNEVKELERSLSVILKEYQSEVSEFFQKLVVKIAILEARANTV